ncbi:MAG: cysteine rich repeat-containing protein [Xanthomonadales bacterium]|jgi:hypothetical protein|nr:cysteine rich repeat-containing protein [Xanthomonadales bacterium]
MKSIKTTLTTLVLLLGVSTAATAGDIVTGIEEGCAVEIEQFCSQVTPGDGRLLACFFAHEDKISGKCQYALYTAAAELEQAATALSYVASQCENDIMAHCADVQLGEGRVLDCLDANKENVSEACQQAVSDVFVKAE